MRVKPVTADDGNMRMLCLVALIVGCNGKSKDEEIARLRRELAEKEATTARTVAPNPAPAAMAEPIKQPAPVAPAEPEEVISVPALIRKYVDNRLAADHWCKGKRLRLYGLVKGFDKVDELPVVILGSGADKVLCAFPSGYDRRLDALKRGNVGVFDCDCSGLADDSIIVGRCRWLTREDVDQTPGLMRKIKAMAGEDD